MCYLYSMVYVYIHSILWSQCVISLWTFPIAFHLSQQLYCDRLIMVFFLFIKFESLVHFELWVLEDSQPSSFSILFLAHLGFQLLICPNFKPHSTHLLLFLHYFLNIFLCFSPYIFSWFSFNLRILSSSVSNLMSNILIEFFISIIVFLTTLLRYNSCGIQFIYLKCLIQ